jgi:predicted protein tyrosine phosphatase
MNVLFVCSQNRFRSPTAEAVFANRPGIECLSAGTNHDADVPLTAELVKWSDLIFVMERTHLAKLRARFQQQIGSRRVVCLGVRDRFEFMDPELVAILKAKVEPHLR